VPVKQLRTWTIRLGEAAPILGVSEVDLEKVLVDKMDMCTVFDLDDEDRFQEDKLRRYFKEVPAVQVRKAFAALRQLE
jgi:hypothetical protein